MGLAGCGFSELPGAGNGLGLRVQGEQDEEGQGEPESMAGYPRKPLAVS